MINAHGIVGGMHYYEVKTIGKSSYNSVENI